MMSLVLGGCRDLVTEGNTNDFGIVDGAVRDDALASGDLACPAMEVLDPSTGTCVQGPFLDIIQCPLYAPDCTLQFMRVAAGGHTKQSVSLRNTGVAPLHVQAISLTGGGPFTFSQTFPLTIAAQDIVGIDVVFAPTSDGFFTGTFNVTSDAIHSFPSSSVPMRAGTLGAGCTSGDTCLVGELCQSSMCATCPTITPPNCQGGKIVLSQQPNQCPQPTCVCTAPATYKQGTGCV